MIKITIQLKRWLTSIIAIPLLLLLIFSASKLLFALFIILISYLALWEYYNLVANELDYKNKTIMIVLSFVISPLLILISCFYGISFAFGIIILNFFICGLISILLFKNNNKIIDHISQQIIGIIYIPFFLSFFIEIRNWNNGSKWVFFIVALIFIGDTAAYYIGSYFGKYKLCPHVSPGKTIEGALAGIVANILFGLLLKLWIMPTITWTLCIAFAVVVGVIGQIGDLFESQLKRNSNIKDSGNIIPGHGGILDRIDAILFAIPMAYYFKIFFL